MYPLHIRNMGSYLAMVTNHTVDVANGQAGIRWYELRYNGASWSLYQQGTYAPGFSDSRWMGAAAINAEGKIGLVYTISSGSTYPSIRYTGRRLEDPPNVMTVEETSIKEATTSQYGSPRWGHYASIEVDPTDGVTFWATHEYASDDDPEPNWDTRIASFQIPDAAPAPLAASILGPDQIDVYEEGTWTAQPSGGTGAYTYRWDFRVFFYFCGGSGFGGEGTEEIECGKWHYGGSDPWFSWLEQYDADLEIKLTVTSGAEVVTVYKTVTIGSGSGARLQAPARRAGGAAAPAATASAGTGAASLPERYALHAVAPNPTSGTGTIRYDLPVASEVALRVYDLLGREVARVASGTQTAGTHRATFDAAGLPSGVYLVRLQAGSFVATDRVTVVE